MPRRTSKSTPDTRASNTPGADDPITTMMAMLLPIHSAVTLDWLADAAATAAERTLNAPYALLYFEEPDGTLTLRAPVSDIRRRSQQRVFDAFGDAIRGPIDPSRSLALAEALEASTPVSLPAADLLRGLIEEQAATEGQQALGVASLQVAQLESAGERIGAVLVMPVGEPNPNHVRLLASHIACAAVNLRQSAQVAEAPAAASDVIRTVFDQRKIESELQREIGRAARYKRPVSICVIEATNLRLLRERFGASLTLRAYEDLGDRLARHSREIDLIGQYKESGYTMILSEAGDEGAQNAVRRLLAIARDDSSKTGLVDGLELHLAAASATYPDDGATAEALFAVADRRMYDPKSQVA
jgi:diguanylate cyclase (GGDEF)-like protein